MQLYKNSLRNAMLFSIALFSAPLLASECGERPQAPEVVDGASATMDELVANSKSVKAFIADADAYLDCNEAIVTSEDFKKMDPADQKAMIETNKKLLKERNDIGEHFNQEVAAYQAANPQ